MGWKTVKEHYQIEHHVQVTNKGMCIGSPYIHDLIVIHNDGTVHPSSIISRDGILGRYVRDLEADQKKLCELMQQQDTFAKSITVYTYQDGKIIEKQCEEPGWPNCTHDGEMMYNNTFSTDRPTVVRWAREDWIASIKITQREIDGLRSDLKEKKEYLAQLKRKNPDNAPI